MKAGWEVRTLGEVCEFLGRGISPKYLETGGICVLNQKCVRDHIISYEQSRRHDAHAKVVNQSRLIQLGDVLVNSTGTGTLGRVAQVRIKPYEETTVDSHVTIVRPQNGLFHLDFFGYMLIMIEKSIQEAGEGCGGQTELARAVLATKFTVSYPTNLAEQERIVSVLDQAFEHIATAKAAAQANLANAKALFESHLQAVFSQRGEGWVETILDKCCDLITCGVASTPKYVDEAVGVPFLSAQNVRDGEVVLDKYRFISKTFHQALTKKNKPQKGDVLYSRVGSKFGEAGVVEHDFEFSVYVSLTLIKPMPDILNSYFLKHYLNSSVVKSMALKSISSSGVPNLNVKDVRQFPINLPPLPSQTKLIKHIGLIETQTRQLEALYQAKLSALDALKQSLLHQAFSGAL